MDLNSFIQPLPFNVLSVLAILVFVLPISTFLLLLFLGHHFKKADWYATVVMFVACFISLYIFKNVWWGETIHSRFDWVNLSNLPGIQNPVKLTLGIRIDKIAALMLVIVTFISSLVHLYSQDYMHGDKQYVRYFAYLNTFTASMLGIVISDNLFTIFVFWELVGLTSYLLIGFWYQKNSAVKASKKAFLLNRIGDLGFLIGLMIIWTQLGTFDLEAIYQLMANASFIQGKWTVLYQQTDLVWLTIAGIGIFCGCIGKSAQFPLQIWLPDAMEGPTPVSALIHAATMVAAGVFLLARVFVLINIDASVFITIIGCISAFVGAYIAVSQNDIKKILAYSTISQLGYMVMGMGAGAYNASLFHLMTHAFFKAGLFLCAGAVIHAMHMLHHHFEHKGLDIHFDPQNIHLMGGLKKAMPKTFYLYFVLTWAAMGLPLSSGFLSKDAILTGVWAWADVMSVNGNVLYYIIPVMGFVTAFITAFYMGRQMFLVFFGEFKLDKIYSEAKGAFGLIHDAGLKMLIPLALLAFLSIGFLFSLNPFSASHAWFMEMVQIPKSLVHYDARNFQEELHKAVENRHTLAMVLSVLVASLGLMMSWLRYGRNKKSELVKIHPYGLATQLSVNNFYMDFIYQKIGVRLMLLIANLCNWIDKNIIDRIVNLIGVITVLIAYLVACFDKYIVDGSVATVVFVSAKVGNSTRSIQSGKIQSYFVFVITVIVLLLAIWCL